VQLAISDIVRHKAKRERKHRLLPLQARRAPVLRRGRQRINVLLKAHRRRLHFLEEERAIKGFDTTPTVKIEIEDIKAEIDVLLGKLRTRSE
jgi:hypothetical protein